MTNQQKAEQLFEDWKHEDASNEFVTERQIDIENELDELGYAIGTAAGEYVLVGRSRYSNS